MPMKRIRTIKPEFFTSEDVTSMPRDVRLTFIGLWLYVDDYGNENAKASLIKAAVWPEDDDITNDVVESHLLWLVEAGQIRFYTVGSRTYLSVVNWSKHQRVDKPSRSNVPEPPTLATRGPEGLATVDPEGPAMEGKGESDRDGGESGEGGEGDDAREPEGGDPSREPEPAILGEPPAPFCGAHPAGTVTPCRACGNKRMLRREWDRKHRQWMDDLMASEDLESSLDVGEVIAS